jgi:hypothetical protein
MHQPLIFLILQIKDNEEELRQELVSNRSTHSSAVYHLLAARLARCVHIDYVMSVCTVCNSHHLAMW